MPAQSRKEERAIRRQEAGRGYKVALSLTMVAAIVGGIISLAAFHAPPMLAGKVGSIISLPIFLIYGGPGFAPFVALYVILWYNPPQKKVQGKPPTTSGGCAD
jgi:hypothetical protein